MTDTATVPRSHGDREPGSPPAWRSHLELADQPLAGPRRAESR